MKNIGNNVSGGLQGVHSLRNIVAGIFPPLQSHGNIVAGTFHHVQSRRNIVAGTFQACNPPETLFPMFFAPAIPGNNVSGVLNFSIDEK